MKRIADYPKVYQDALAYWCAFRDLGFSADDIFFGLGTVSGVRDCVFLMLTTQDKDFTVTVGRLPGAVEADVHETWKQLADAVHVSSVDERRACSERHLIGSNRDYYATFVAAIHSKGILIPELAPLAQNKA